MSRVLKLNGQSDASDIRPLSSAWNNPKSEPALTPAVNPEVLKLREERDLLQRRLDQQDAKLAELRKEVEAAFRKGEAEGREAGKRAVENNNAAMLSRLEAGIRQAAGTFVQTLSGLERLAPALAREGLAVILGPGEARAEQVTAIVVQNLRTLESHSVVQVEVSASDFDDEAALEALREALGASGLRIQVQAGLKSGDCRIRLKLGTVEVGLDQQWQRLSSLLDEMAEPGSESGPASRGDQNG